MTATTDTRKRSREDDSSDSMPLSKRINNLHINNNNFIDISSDGSHPSTSHGTVQQIHQHLNHGSHHHVAPIMSHHHNIQPETVCFESQRGPIHNPLIGNSIPMDYNPELNQTENPYYYNKNKLLYELHLERTRRIQP